MRIPIYLLITTGFLIASLGFVRMADPFENTRWKLQLVTTDAGAKDGPDTVSFKAGKFNSEFFAKHGFKECNYEDDTRRGGVGSFTAEQTSEKEGKLKWTATVTAVDMRGEVLWTKPNGDTINFSFTGERLPK